MRRAGGPRGSDRERIGRMLREGRVRHGDRSLLATGAGVTVRTLHNWQHREPSPRGPGRPPRPARERRRALRLVARASKRVGRGAGWLTVRVALPEPVPDRLGREILAALKARWRRREGERLGRRRVHTEVLAKDVLWSLDATHAGDGTEAVVVREVATTRTIDLRIGGAPDARDLVLALERARDGRGCLPLVLALDNGGPMRSEELRAWAEREGVVLLHSLPRTPQHNAWSERGMRDLKEEAGLETRTARARSSRRLRPAEDPGLREADTAFPGPPGGPCATGPPSASASVLDVAARLARARHRLDHWRPRASRGGRTAVAVDAALPSWYRAVARERFHAAACSAIRDALPVPATARARRLAEREAILATMERFGLIRRTRGGVPLLVVETEKIS